MPSHGRKRRDSWSDDDAVSTSERNHPSTSTDPPSQQGESHHVSGLSLSTCKSGGGWAVGSFRSYIPSHDDQVRAKTSTLLGNANEQCSSSRATPETSGGTTSRRSPAPMSGTNGEVTSAGEEEEVPTKDCYFPPSQDNGEDDKDTFVDKGSTAAFYAPSDDATVAAGAAVGHAAVSSPPGAVETTSAAAATPAAKRSNKVRLAVNMHGPPSSIVLGGPSSAMGGLSPSPNLINSGSRFGNSNSNAPNITTTTTGTLAGDGGGGASFALSPAATTTTMNAPTNIAASGGGIGGTPGPSTRFSGTANMSPVPHTSTSLLRRNNAAKIGTNTVANTPQYSRLNSSEAAPGVVYRATLAVRAMAMDPEQPVLWAAVGDDPLAALRIDGGELSHSKSVKGIEQVHCMAVVRIAEDQGTTFKSASASPRGGSSTLKQANSKTGRNSKKNGRRSVSTRKSSKLGAAATNTLIPLKNVNGEGENDDEIGSISDASGDASPSGGRSKPTFSNYLWCGMSRGHMAVVNMTTLEYQVIHNAHTQTVNRIWYWEARNKVWTAGREKGVHIWDPQRRVILKKRNIAAILTDATYAEVVDKVFAIAGDPCVRVFEPGGENVNVPKGQENRIKMKSDASVIQYHQNSRLVWVGLARGSVLMNPVSMDVERTLPFTFSAILFEGEHAIIAGQEGQNGESRLMVLDVANPQEPTVLAYTKFANPLPLGIQVIPNTRFAVVAQDDSKKGVVVVIFVYTGTVALTHTATTSSKYPEQRTEKVIRVSSAGAVLSSPAQISQQPLTITAPLSLDMPASILTSTAGSPAPTMEPSALTAHAGSGNHTTTTTATNTNNNNNGVVVMADRTSLHRAAVVKFAPESRTDRKFNVEANHSTLVEAIGPEAQEIKSALKHLVKTTDEVRQSLVQQRSAEATLADFSRLLRDRQQWLMEQGPITNLPVLTSHLTERINRNYVTPEGKTIATAIEQLQQMYDNVQVKLQQLQKLQQQQQQRPLPSFANPSAPKHLPPSPSSPLGLDYATTGTTETSALNRVTGSDERRAPSFLESDANNSKANDSSRTVNAIPAFQGGCPAGIGSNVNDLMLLPWASQLAATLQRERLVHEKQLSALQLKMERLTERNAAFSTAFARLQAHVAALGQQSFSVLDMDSIDSIAAVDSEDLDPMALRQRDQQRCMLSVLSTQQEAAIFLFHQLSRSRYHKPKHVRQVTEVLVKAIDELVRLTKVKTLCSREPDSPPRTAVLHNSGSAMLANTPRNDRNGSVEVRHSPMQVPRYPVSTSPSPNSPSMTCQRLPPPRSQQHTSTSYGISRGAAAAMTDVAGKVASCAPHHPAGVEEGTNQPVDRPITSFRGACDMAEAELHNLRTLNAEAMSFCARLQNTSQQSTSRTAVTTAATPDDEVTESSVKSIDSGLLSLSPRATGASPTLLHLMAARALQAVCWAECWQTVLRELTNASGLENPFVAGCVHNSLVSARTISVGLNGTGEGYSQEWWRQGPLEVLDYESAQERAEVLHKIRQISTTSGMEITNATHIRETLQARYCTLVECQMLHKDSDFTLHRLPGALCWSQTALRLLFEFLEGADTMLTVVNAVRRKGGSEKTEEKGLERASDTTPPPYGVDTRTASAVGVAMTHWALFLLSLRAELLAVHHATRLYHAWCWGTAPLTSSSSTVAATAAGAADKSSKSNCTIARRVQQGATAKAPEEHASSLAEIAASLSSKGKLLLLYMQWCFPAFCGAADTNGMPNASGITGAEATSAAVSTATATTMVNVPSFFTADLENDAASTTAVHRSAAECATMLAGVVTHTAQLLRRVMLLLLYCHAIRARSLTALKGSSDATVARLVRFAGPTAFADVDARDLTEQEKAFLRSETPFIV